MAIVSVVDQDMRYVSSVMGYLTANSFSKWKVYSLDIFDREKLELAKEAATHLHNDPSISTIISLESYVLDFSYSTSITTDWIQNKIHKLESTSPVVDHDEEDSLSARLLHRTMIRIRHAITNEIAIELLNTTNFSIQSAEDRYFYSSLQKQIKSSTWEEQEMITASDAMKSSYKEFCSNVEKERDSKIKQEVLANLKKDLEIREKDQNAPLNHTFSIVKYDTEISRKRKLFYLKIAVPVIATIALLLILRASIKQK